MLIAKRTTVLPEVDLRAGSPTLIQSNKDRYEFKKTLGEGAVGEVELARDNDIHRMVAIKRLKKSLHSPSTLLRFAEEIRTVGSLEHPNIIPIHDVGVDEEGRYYFVMKHIQGVTIEHIIERLQAGDAEYHAKYSFEYRARICMEILRAMQFAHSHGVIHRDLKPANIMVGPFGEVVVMDWGIAKRIRQITPPNAQIQGFLDQLDHDIAQRLEADGGSRERLFQTRNDTLLGTPMYMSPEQALGHNDKLDERSDIYSLFVVFYEFLTLHHYLEGAASLEELLRGILQREPKNPLLNRHTTQPPIPADLHWFLLWGFQKDPAKRPQTIAEIIHRLQRIEDGYAHIQCPVTLNKRAATGFAHFINRHPVLSTLSTLFAATLMLGGCAFFVLLFLP
ncbi:serine/threonine protein kinase [Myxococcota bacterium]|nr:serine/threonine protein kinase [Myxococcota bacterium]